MIDHWWSTIDDWWSMIIIFKNFSSKDEMLVSDDQ